MRGVCQMVGGDGDARGRVEGRRWTGQESPYKNTTSELVLLIFGWNWGQ